MSRVLAVLLLVSVFIVGCAPSNRSGAPREAFDKVEAENQAIKKELAQALAESKRLQQEVASLKAAKEAEKTALAVKAEEQAIALRRMEALRTPPPAAEPEMEKPPRTLEAALKDEMANGNGAIRQGDGVVTIELLEPALYYNSASATIRPEGLKVLKRIADVLKNGADKEIRVEAHTDVMIQTARFPSTMALAVARANGVLRFLKTQYAAGLSRMSAVGYAEAQPAKPSDSSQSRNRRVEIIVHSK